MATVLTLLAPGGEALSARICITLQLLKCLNSNTIPKYPDFSQIYVNFMMTIKKNDHTPNFDLFSPFFGPGISILGEKENENCSNQKSYLEKNVSIEKRKVTSIGLFPKSDVVTKTICVSVRSHFFSLEHSKHLKQDV